MIPEPTGCKEGAGILHRATTKERGKSGKRKEFFHLGDKAIE